MKRNSAFFAVAACVLTSCATPAIKERVTEVNIPVAIQPIRPEQVPVAPKPLAARPLSLSAAADALLSKWCEAVAYIVKADPLLRISAGQQPTAVTTYPECE